MGWNLVENRLKTRSDIQHKSKNESHNVLEP